jgi:hypothetical protein
MFDNRQLATLIILAAFLAWALTRRDVRGRASSLIKTLVHPKVVIPFLLYGAWLVGLHWLSWRMNLWNARLTGESIFWAGATGLALLTLAMTEAGKKDNFFRDAAVDTIKFAAFFEFFINIKSLSLVGELLMQPVIAILAMLRAFVEHDEQNKRLRKPLDVLLSLVTLGLLIYTVRSLVQDWPRIDKVQEVRKLLMPIWLTLGAFPFVFVFALIADYEQVFCRMKVTTGLKRTSLRARLGVVLALRTRLLDIHGFGGQHAKQAGNARTARGGMEAVHAFRAERARKAAEEQARLDRLEALAGVKGTDEAGRQLDRREFDETQDALRWIATCHMGWYNRRKRYRRDLMTIVNDFSLQGLPAEHGIVMKVRKDGQAWYAYRRTISGWVLGIGANKGTPDQWFYDGPQPPASYPRPGGGWGGAAHLETANWT